MAYHRKDKRTPEEIAKAREVVKQVRLKHDKIKAKKDIERGRIAIIIVAVIEALGVAYYYFQVSDNILELIINTVIVSIFVGMAILYPKKPLVVSISALSFYVLLIALNAFYDPKTIFQGILLKTIVIGMLTTSIIKAYRFKDVLKELEKKEEVTDELLDEELG